MDVTTALRILHASTGGIPVAPHVAGRLAEHARGDALALAALGSLFSAAQLRGASMLPDPLPMTPELRSVAADSLLTAERRLLLFAALDGDLTLPELIDAAGVEPDVLLFGALPGLLHREGGHARFTDERLRAQILHESTPRERGAAHAALARAHRRRGDPPAAAAHLLAENTRRLPELVIALTARAEILLGQGRLQEAYGLARAVASAGGESAARAWCLAGRSAIWAGAFADGREALTHVELSSPWGETSRDLLQALDIIEQGPQGVYYTAEDTVKVFGTLAATAPAEAERRLTEGLGTVLTTLYEDPRHADALLAKAMLGVPSVLDPSWTPLAAATLAVAQLTASVFAGDYDSAGALLAATAPRFPLALLSDGIVAEFARVCLGRGTGLDEQLVQAYRSITRETRLRLSDELAAILRFSADSTVLARAASDFGIGRAMPDGTRKPAPVPVETLSRRQGEVLALVLRGLGNREIATELTLSPRTVEVHVTLIMRKYEVRSRTALLALHAAH